MELSSSETASRTASGEQATTSSSLSYRLADAHAVTYAGEQQWILTYFCEARHDVQGEGGAQPVQEQGIVSKWRQKERLKTTAVALVLCLNIGVDPPDVIKISPCARLECWVDPLSMQPPKALETIGKNLQAQYERWQPRAKYKTHLDPTMDDVKKLAISCRRSAKNERVLFHYNGHGVPRPTANGEIWVFNKSYTQYIPMSIYDLQAWVGSPAIYTFDCSAAGLIINSFRAFAEQRSQEADSMGHSYMTTPRESEDLMREVILLAACSAGEVLPQTPDLPADVFTACLTTPIKVALRWFCSRSLLRAEGLTKELIDRIPGKQTDRKTPLGELNWIFTAITDTIAWNMLPRSLFQRLFRQDLLVASLFRNFLLAERIMRAASCTPVSYPRLPPTHQHPMWQAWDMAAEMCLLQLPALLNGDPEAEFRPSPFFAEQLTAFELWLAHGSAMKQPPEQLPIVLQVLLSQVHRLRALVLLGRFLDMGSWAVDLALSVGIFPYVLKLLQTTAADLRTTLVFIWTKILALDKSCQADLVKDGGHQYFIKYLEGVEPGISADSRAQAAFVLAVICDGYPRGRMLCAEQGLLPKLLSLLATMAGVPALASGGQRGAPSPPLLVKWLCLSLGRLVEDQADLIVQVSSDALLLLSKLLLASHPEVRAAAVFALSICIQVGEIDMMWDSDGGNGSSVPEHRSRLEREREIACYLLMAVYDASPLVRAEVAVGLARLAEAHSVLFQDAVQEHQRQTSRMLRDLPSTAPALALAGQSPPVARSAPSESVAGRALERLSSSHGAAVPLCDAANQASATADMLENRRQSGAGLPRPSSDSNFSASPGVCRAPSGDGFEATLRVGPTSPNSPIAASHLAAPSSEAGSPPSGAAGAAGGGGSGTVYASADAARVGGGLYQHLLHAAVTLATDPAPVVAAVGAAVLRVAGVELAEAVRLPASATAPLSAAMLARAATSAAALPASAHAALNAAAAAGSAAGSAGSAGGSGSGKWRSWRGSSSAHGRPLPASASSSPPSPPLPAQLPNPAARRPFILKPLQANGHLTPARAATPPAHSPGGASTSSSQNSHLPPRVPALANGAGSSRKARLPASLVYKSSCEYFSRPLLSQQPPGGYEGKLEFASLPCVGHSTFAAHDPARTASRLKEREEKRQACMAVGRNARLREHVTTVNFECKGVAALLHHPFRPLLVGVDERGTVRVYNHRHSAFVNAFHLAADRPTTVVNCWQLNEAQAGLLMVGGADGSVRVWRDYTFRGTQRLATAWQAVPLAAGGAGLAPEGPAPTAYEWSENLNDGTLLAVGGSTPSTVHLWNLQHELCVEQIPVEDKAAAGRGGTIVQRLGVSRYHPLMLAGTATGTVLLYDLRSPHTAAATLKPHTSPMVGMALEPGGVKDQLVTAAADGEMKMVDFRMLSDTAAAGNGPSGGATVGGSLGVWKTVNASATSRNLSALAAHPNAPLLATGTATQVVKLWSALGEQLGVIRATTSLLDSRRPGPVNTLAFHPYQLALASGGGDSIVNLYNIQAAEVPDRAYSTPVH
ncbi:g4847 [Coccomyxa elongata]